MTQAAKAPKTDKPVTAAQTFPFPTFDIAKFEMPKFEMPKFDGAAFDLSKVEVPAAMREAADKAVAQMKDGYAKLKAAAEETTDLVEDTYTTASAGVKDFNLKAIEAARINMNAGFDHARDLMGAKSLAEVIEMVKGWPASDGGGNVQIEIRQVVTAEDLGFSDAQLERYNAMVQQQQ